MFFQPLRVYIVVPTSVTSLNSKSLRVSLLAPELASYVFVYDIL